MASASIAIEACGGQTTATADAGLDSGCPDPPAAIPLDGGANFAIHHLFLGDTDRNGIPSASSAWKEYGRNVDGKMTTRDSTDVCTLTPGAPKATQEDGNDGIDNSWGSNIMPLIFTVVSQDYSRRTNDAVNAGKFTTMIDVVGLTSDPAQTSGSTPAQIFLGATFNGAPTWTPADDWPVRREMLADGQTLASGSKFRFPAGRIDTGTWNSCAPTDVPLSLPLGRASLDLVVHHALLSFDHVATTKAMNGTLSGVLDTNEVIDAAHKVAGQLSCSGAVFDSVASQIRQASDILVDGTNVAGQPCDGISIGLGFVADEIGPPNTVAPAQPPSPDPCDAGAD